MSNVTSIIYKNSSDDSYALRINFEKIHDVVKEINNYVEDFSMDFTEWVMDNYTKTPNEDSYLDISGVDHEIYDIDDLIEKFKKINNITH